MRIAVTGSSGRVGRAITEAAVAEGHSVVGIDRVPPAPVAEGHGVVGLDQAPPAPAPEHEAFQFIQADITQYDELEQAMRGCDALVHMAAIPGPWQHPDHLVHNLNVTGSYNALRAAAELGIERICQASSVNATGGVYSRTPRYDYFPLDEQHPTYAEDPYSLSKWICEMQADSMVRRYENLSIASLRLHWMVPERPSIYEDGQPHPLHAKHLWGYTRFDAAARACLLCLTVPFKGHEVLYIIAPDTSFDGPTLDLLREHYPDVPVRGDLSGQRGLFNCAKAEQLLGWKHDLVLDTIP